MERRIMSNPLEEVSSCSEPMIGWKMPLLIQYYENAYHAVEKAWLVSFYTIVGVIEAIFEW